MVRQRSAKPLFVGSTPIRASNNLRRISPLLSAAILKLVIPAARGSSNLVIVSW